MFIYKKALVIGSHIKSPDDKPVSTCAISCVHCLHEVRCFMSVVTLLGVHFVKFSFMVYSLFCYLESRKYVIAKHTTTHAGPNVT